MAEDFTTTNNPKYLYLAELHRPFPEWVAAQEMPSADAFSKMASTAFADPGRRLLPIATKEAAFHSAINLFACMDQFDEAVFERVKSACAMYGIEGDIAPYAELFAEEVEKSASEQIVPEGRFAIDTQLGGEHFKLLPINDTHEVIQSAFDLAKMASENRIHFLLMVPAARELVKVAGEMGVNGLPEMVVRFGSERFPDAEKAASLIAGREGLCRDADTRAVLPALYKEALASLNDDPDAAMEKIAAIDHQAGISVNYRLNSAVPTPFDIVFGGQLMSEAIKAAQENVLVFDDVTVPLVELKKIPTIDAEFRLSKQASESFSKIRDVDDARDVSLAIAGWSETDKRTLLRMAVDAAA